jgi:hypothetical protein
MQVAPKVLTRLSCRWLPSAPRRVLSRTVRHNMLRCFAVACTMVTLRVGIVRLHWHGGDWVRHESWAVHVVCVVWATSSSFRFHACRRLLLVPVCSAHSCGSECTSCPQTHRDTCDLVCLGPTATSPVDPFAGRTLYSFEENPAGTALSYSGSSSLRTSTSASSCPRSWCTSSSSSSPLLGRQQQRSMAGTAVACVGNARAPGGKVRASNGSYVQSSHKSLLLGGQPCSGGCIRNASGWCGGGVAPSPPPRLALAAFALDGLQAVPSWARAGVGRTGRPLTRPKHQSSPQTWHMCQPRSHLVASTQLHCAALPVRCRP